jgi:hypothetical protein
LAVVLVYRLLSFWLTIPVGWFASRYVARAESTYQRESRVYARTGIVPPTGAPGGRQRSVLKQSASAGSFGLP